MQQFREMLHLASRRVDVPKQVSSGKARAMQPKHLPLNEEALQKAAMKQMLRQSIALHQGFELIAGAS